MISSGKWKDINCMSIDPLLQKSIGLDQIICGNIKETNWRDFVNSEGKNQCTNLGQKISKSLVRVAATRIFSNPAQSILELPVNSIDAYRGDRTIGKFGMGFFSILYWILNKKRGVVIDSVFKQSDGQLCQWRGVIRPQGDDLYIVIDEPASSLTETGTRVAINAFSDPFTPEEIDEFSSYIRRLFDIKDVGVSLNGLLVNVPEDGSPIVEIGLNLNAPYVEDRATGISYDVLFNSLLTPSISTKTIVASTKPVTFVDKTRIIGNIEGKNLFVITVGDIAIVKLTYKIYKESRGRMRIGREEEEETKEEKFHTYILSMPLNSKVPVSRDDVVIENNTLEELYLWEGITTLIEMSISKIHTLIPIFRLLRRYSDYSGQKTVSRLVDLAIRNTMARDDILFVPDTASIYEELEKQLKNVHFVSVESPPIYKTEEKLSRILEGKYNNTIYREKKVIFLPNIEEVVSDGKLPSFLFINEDYVNKTIDWKSNIAIAYTNGRLLTFTQIGQDVILETKSLLDFLKFRKYENLLIQLSLAMRSNLINFDNITTEVLEEIKEKSRKMKSVREIVIDVFKTIKLYDDLIRDDFKTKEYISEVYNFFSHLKASHTYGQKSYFHTEELSLEKVNRNLPKPYDKFYQDGTIVMNDLSVKLSQNHRNKLRGFDDDAFKYLLIMSEITNFSRKVLFFKLWNSMTFHQILHENIFASLANKRIEILEYVLDNASNYLAMHYLYLNM